MKQNETKTITSVSEVKKKRKKNTKKRENLDSRPSVPTEERGYEIVKIILVKKRHLNPPEEGGKKKRKTVPYSTTLENKKKICKSRPNAPRVLAVERESLEKKKSRTPK